MRDDDKAAANAADPHQYGDNDREDDYLAAFEDYFCEECGEPISKSRWDFTGLCFDCTYS